MEESPFALLSLRVVERVNGFWELSSGRGADQGQVRIGSLTHDRP